MEKPKIKKFNKNRTRKKMINPLTVYFKLNVIIGTDRNQEISDNPKLFNELSNKYNEFDPIVVVESSPNPITLSFAHKYVIPR